MAAAVMVTPPRGVPPLPVTVPAMLPGPADRSTVLAACCSPPATCSVSLATVKPAALNDRS
ncbi:MAG TPA: hypothetical protein VFP61_04320 [Acidimicrobiales bacterium]|nr:hypothetical protein [Acidimicrobiales bacterium]